MQDVMWCDRMGGVDKTTATESIPKAKQSTGIRLPTRLYPTQHLDQHDNSISHTTHIAGEGGRAGWAGAGTARRWRCTRRRYISGPRRKQRQANKRSQQGQTNKKGTHTRQHQHTHNRSDHRRERDKAWGGSARWRASRRKREEGARGPAWQSTVKREVSGQVRQCCDLVRLLEDSKAV